MLFVTGECWLSDDLKYGPRRDNKMNLINKLAGIQPLNRFVKGAVARLPYSLRVAVLGVIRNGIVQYPPFHGVYQRFDEIKSTYSSAYSFSRAAETHAKAGLSFKREEAAGLIILRRSHWLLPVVVGLLSKRDEPVRILDFGGGGGVDFVAVKETSDAQLQYHIVEMPEICEAGRKLWPNEPAIRFSEGLPESGKFDIVYSWSAVHYVSDPLDLLARFTGYRPEAILIVHSPFSQRSFVRAQVKGSADASALGDQPARGRARHARQRLSSGHARHRRLYL